MSQATVFVHGTGVRGTAYAHTVRRIRRGLESIHDSSSLLGCFWGDSEGAALGTGASVPGCTVTDAPKQRDRELALWSVLYVDPWYELRLLAQHTGEGNESPPGRDPTGALIEQIRDFRPSPDLCDLLAEQYLEDLFHQALESLRSSPEFAEAAETAPSDPLAHRQAIARALVAHAQSGLEPNEPTMDGAARDRLVRLITSELDGYGRGVGDWVTRQFAGMAKRALTHRLTRRRGPVTDAMTPAAGDILRYQARGAGIRSAIRRAVLSTRADHVTLLTHSLGGIASFDLLAMAPLPQVTRLITVGSQSPYLYEIGALTSLEPPATVPAHFPAWLNIYDPRDFLSFIGEPLFPNAVTDVPVDNGQPFPQAHSAYWTNQSVWDAIAAFRS
ncbi:hypothetical protein [Streptomyces sp. CRN 30]|uniref:hypothetical protein n=1 Tax=Streptomyces sp. CRN 30 TaxID=3075613 RepID=UPI002A8248EC|nr:hypothetical protein [Streptomyces sp. CRN 30]